MPVSEPPASGPFIALQGARFTSAAFSAMNASRRMPLTRSHASAMEFYAHSALFLHSNVLYVPQRQLLPVYIAEIVPVARLTNFIF